MTTKITAETRREAYRARPVTRKGDILNALTSPMTARELANRLGFVERNAVAPRLTELEKEGFVKVTGKKIEELTGRKVAIYEKVEIGS